MNADPPPADPSPRRRLWEWATFAFLAVVFWPAVTLAGIGGYGLILWLNQKITQSPLGL